MDGHQTVISFKDCALQLAIPFTDFLSRSPLQDCETLRRGRVGVIIVMLSGAEAGENIAGVIRIWIPRDRLAAILQSFELNMTCLLGLSLSPPVSCWQHDSM